VTTHLLRFDPDIRLASQWMAAEGLTPNGEADDGYGWHALLCAAFGKADAPKPFRILARRGRPVQLLAYSPLAGAELMAHAAAFADPKAFAALGVDELASKLMPRFSPGRRLGFSLRVRPVVRADRDGDRAKTREIDAYVHARANGDTREKAEIYLDWVRERLAAGGAEVEALRVDGLESVKVMRRGGVAEGGRPLKPIAGHAVAIVGSLRVADETRFAEAIARGVGRHRAFGFGMLLLAPPEG
jgi:CRISPR system Cascade subunit CasE